MNRFDRQLPKGLRIWNPEPKADSSLEASENAESLDSGTRSQHSPRTERELDRISGIAAAKTRSVPLKVFVPLLVEAQERNSAWLEDFQDDNVVIDADLHEVLLAYQNLRNRRDAA
ncbi:hypothetical protein LOC67_20885 [Stieleria sp. JC731]|uniref:hypothetical protein n=1 Tax=Pirellulaceae TaxID=2691357 RepID=UPI001E466E99|nr:hypothetical protein [Stieleria sp. JC731]MCC9603011.1 hypothetical protein [Stieleria sp. JC731]